MIDILHNYILAAEVDLEKTLGTVITLVCLAGVGVLISWQVKTPGLSALEHCPVRRTRLPLFFPFLQLFVWLVGAMLCGEMIKKLLASRPEITIHFVQYAAMTVLDIGLLVFFLLVAKFGFVRGLRGFGLNWRKIPKDLGWAMINLAAIYPVVLMVLHVTVEVGKQFAGPEFKLQEHQTLVEMNQANPVWMQVLLVLFAVAIVPVFEEVLFRGLIQSTLSAHLPSPWMSIGITSALFAGLHYGTHSVGIFVLACCLGYAYERSGSLWRPIFIHILFNSISVAGVLFLGI
ncbi:MAG: CPBP family intramembrane metalloprotease [Sedimentisphaerales bacterium]|nr:CPBP family intramembrane metalloprotease [Sedimentisphaerales bacterium]